MTHFEAAPCLGTGLIKQHCFTTASKTEGQWGKSGLLNNKVILSYYSSVVNSNLLKA